MKLAYEEPTIEIRNYSVPPVLTVAGELSFTTETDPDLEDGDGFDIFT